MRRTLTLASLVAALGLVACGGQTINSGNAPSNGPTSTTTQFPMTITTCGHTITFDKQPQRVLTMGPDAATLVAAAGAVGKIVARKTILECPWASESPQASGDLLPQFDHPNLAFGDVVVLIPTSE